MGRKDRGKQGGQSKGKQGKRRRGVSKTGDKTTGMTDYTGVKVGRGKQETKGKYGWW